MKHDVPSLKAGESVLSAFPDLAALPAFADYGEGGNDCFARFAVLYAAPDSPYRDLPLDDKKRACLKGAGIAPGAPRYDDVLAWLDLPVVAMINMYVRQRSSLRYALWFHGCEAAYQTIEKLSVPIEGAKEPIIIFQDEGDDDDSDAKGVDKSAIFLSKKIAFYGRAIIKALVKGKGKVAGEMDEAKTQVAYKTRHDNLEAMFKKVPELDKLGNELFMGDEQLREVSQLALLEQTPTAEKRAEGRSFIPPVK